MPITITNSFDAGTPAIADDVNKNFQDIKTYMDSLVVKTNEAVFSVFPELPVGTPTSVQAVPKSYVDTTTNKMSGQITSLHTTPRDQVATTGYEVVSDQDFVIPATITEAVTFKVEAGWVLSNNTGTSGAGLFKYEICWDTGALTPVYTLLAPASALLTSSSTGSYSILSNEVMSLSTPFYASQAAAGKTVRIRFSVSQPAAGVTMWLVTPRTLVTVTREVPFA